MSRMSDIYARVPVNKLAALVTNQNGCSLVDVGISYEDARYIKDRLCRKHQMLKHVLGIKNRAQHKNACGACNKGKINVRAEKEPRVFAEYRIIGRQILNVQAALSRFKEDKKLIGSLEHKWKMECQHTVVMPNVILKQKIQAGEIKPGEQRGWVR